MAKITANPAVRLALLLSLSTLAACGSNGNGLIALDKATPALGAANGAEGDSYTTVIPRDPFPVDPDAPDKYTVVKGDTLWDISDRFLDEAWLWPQLWDYNPQIQNPHLIFPGDVVGLEYINGEPRLVIERDGQIIGQSGGAGSERLSPRIRTESLANAIPMISGEAISSFLVHPRVIGLADINAAPYIVGNNDGRLISAVGHRVYARGELNRQQPQYAVFRKSKQLKDPITQRTLGYEVQHVSDLKLIHLGDPSTLLVTSNNMETIAGDILLPTNEENVVSSYKTRLPALSQDGGRVISLVNSISQTGRNQVVVLNLGKNNDIRAGDVLAIESHGKSIIDTRGKGGFEEITLPNTRTGVVMVFKTFDEVSYALVMESTLPVRVNDGVTGI